jgi:hypothetical protein
MIRYLMGAGLALLLCTFTLLAGEYKGVLKSVNTDNNTFVITITTKVDDKEKTEDKTFKYDKDKVKVVRNKKGEEVDVDGGFTAKQFAAKALEKNMPNVTITTEGDGDKEMATKVKLGGKKAN